MGVRASGAAYFAATRARHTTGHSYHLRAGTLWRTWGSNPAVADAKPGAGYQASPTVYVAARRVLMRRAVFFNPALRSRRHTCPC